MYIGSRFHALFSDWVHRSLMITSKRIEEVKIDSSAKIIVIDGGSIDDHAFSKAIALRASTVLSDKVWIYIQQPSESVSLELCYREGFDDVIQLATPSSIERAILKGSLLIEQKRHYLEQLDMAQSMARTALTNSSELGTIIRLLADLVKVDDVNDFVYCLIDWFMAQNLTVCIQVRFDEEKFEFSSNSLVKPIESKLLTEGGSGSRIVEFGRKLLFNECHISILIKNMPANDEERMGRLRDHFATISHTCESLLTTMKYKYEHKKRMSCIIRNGIEDFKYQFTHVCEEVFQYMSESRSQLEKFQTKMYDNISEMDLSEEQYNQACQAISDFNQNNEDLDDLNLDLESKLSQLEQKIRIALPS
jgi:hypothetical protein